MRVKALAVAKEETAARLLTSFRRLMDARSDWLHLKPTEFFTEGTYPAAKWQVKLYCIAMRPGRAWYRAGGRAEDLALEAARLLEERNGVCLDWAAGLRKTGEVWLFVKPWAWRREAWRRAWFRPSPEDLGALRVLA